MATLDDNVFMKLTDKFRTNLSAALKKPGAPSARALSLKSGGSESMVRQILSGNSASPKLDTVERLAESLGISEEELLFGNTRPAIERKLISVFRTLSPEEQLLWIERAEAAASHEAQ